MERLLLSQARGARAGKLHTSSPDAEMFSLHAPTLFMFNIILSATMGVLLIWLWLRDRGQMALLSWGISRLCGVAAMPLLVLRNVLPNWISINLANTFICFGFALIWTGARQFENRAIRPVLILAGPSLWLLACEMPVFYNRLEARLALVGCILAAYLAAAAWEFQRGKATRPLRSRPFLVAMLIAMAAVYLLGMGLVLVLPPAPRGFDLPGSPWFSLLFCVAICLLAGTAILLVALTKEAAEWQSTSALAAARDQANAASDQKSRFLARMSHELRTPLNGMLGLAQVLARDPDQGERQRRQAATLEQAGRHLLEILNEVLDLSRIEAGRLDLSPRPTVLTDFLHEMIALIQESAEARHIRLELVTSRALPEAVLVDPMRLRQILLNLLSNAVKFTPPGGRVVLTAAREARETLRFAVTGSGRGVSASLRPQLFEDYTQGFIPGDQVGTGLGLPISARLANAMQGKLSHTDGPGGIGSQFTLTVPLPAVRPAAPAPLAAPMQMPPGRLRILVVDDVALNRFTARALLEHVGHSVDVAEDAASALAALARNPPPDIILLDQMMPDMTGYDLARQIRAMDGPMGQVPILAVTASTLPEDIDACLAAGMDGHIAKPIDLKLLLPVMARALDRTGVAA